MPMGLPSPNTARFPSHGRLSRMASYVPSPVQNAFRIRGSKIVRITALGISSRHLNSTNFDLVLVLLIWIIILTSGNNGASQRNSEWLGKFVGPARHSIESVRDFMLPNVPTRHAHQAPESQDALSDPETEEIPSNSTPTLEEVSPPANDRARPAGTELPDPPPTRSPSHTRLLTIATMLRNQRRWLREWIEFNLMMGVDHFIIYDNDSTDQPLEILQHYIDRGYITYIPWPPKQAPQLPQPRTALEEWQLSWFKDSLETCMQNTWTIHRQGPCQLAAFTDAILRTKNGVSRWLGIWDIDEFIFPRVNSGFSSLATILRQNYADHDHIRIYGNVFGTSGHVEHAARRQPGSSLQALLTEEYTYRAELDRISLPELI
jgi:Glycosyltransferase family 92